MKHLIKEILKEEVDQKMLNFLINRFGKESLLKSSARKLIKMEDGSSPIENSVEKQLHDFGVSSDELMDIKNYLYGLDSSNKKIDEYVKKYGDDPRVAKERFLKDVVSQIPGRTSSGIRTEIYDKFLKKLSEYVGTEITRGHSRPEKSNLLLKLSKFIEEPTDTPKSRGEFLKTLGVPRSHYSTTFNRLLRNNLIKSVKKNGKWVYELGDNFDRFIQGDPQFVGDMEKLFKEFVNEHGNNREKFKEKYRPMFYYSSDWTKFWISFLKYTGVRIR